jgi:hypothetical protein
MATTRAQKAEAASITKTFYKTLSKFFTQGL